MQSQQILTKAIEKAITGGWKPTMPHILNYRYYSDISRSWDYFDDGYANSTSSKWS